MIEYKQIKATVCRAGGTASKSSQMVRIVIPADCARAMGITKEANGLVATFDGETIKLRRE